MKIVYDTDSAFYAGIRKLTMDGLGFVAHHATLTITLTGNW
jgi:hypothetical protein